MSLRRVTPCDCDGICPYESESYSTCEYQCGTDEHDDVDETNYDPFCGCDMFETDDLFNTLLT